MEFLTKQEVHNRAKEAVGKTIKELRQLITQEELVYWAAYYENKSEHEKRMHEMAKNR